MNIKTSTQSHDHSLKNKGKRIFLKTKIGIWIDGKLYWLRHGTEKILLEESITISIRQEAIHSDICLSNIFVTNHNGNEREVKIFVMHYHDDHSADQFTFISPTEKVIYHLANGSVFLVNGHMDGEFMKEYSIQPIWNVETDEFWNCKNKGTLFYQPMFRGLACSVFSINIALPGLTTSQGNTWIITGESKSKLIQLNQVLAKKLTSSTAN